MSDDLNVKVSVDDSGIDKGVKKVQEKLSSIKTPNVGDNLLNESTISKKISSIKEKLKTLSTGESSFNINSSAVNQAVAAAKKSINELQIVKLEATLDKSRFEAELKALNNNQSITVKIKPSKDSIEATKRAESAMQGLVDVQGKIADKSRDLSANASALLSIGQNASVTAKQVSSLGLAYQKLSYEMNEAAVARQIQKPVVGAVKTPLINNQASSGYAKLTGATQAYVSAANKANSASNTFTKSLAKVGTSASTASTFLSQFNMRAGRIDSGLTAYSNSAKGLLMTLASYAGLNKTITAADQWTTVSNRIRLVTQSESELIEVRERLLQVSNNTGQALDSTASLYASMARAQDELKLSTEQVLNITDSMTKALAIGGGTAEGNQAAVTQLSQAMASGVLRGEEFNSMMEQAPAIAKYLAEGLKVPVGSLRSLAEQGDITADKFTNAILSMKDAIDEDFKNRAQTISQAFQVLNNEFSKFIGETGETSGAINFLVGAIKFAADNIGTLVTIATVLTGIKFVTFFVGAAKSVGRFIGGLTGVTKKGLEAVASQSKLAAGILATGRAMKVQAANTLTLANAYKVVAGAASQLSLANKATTLTTTNLAAVTKSSRFGLGTLAVSLGGIVTAGAAAAYSLSQAFSAISNFAQGKDASNEVSRFVDSLFGLDSEKESLGTWLYDQIADPIDAATVKTVELKSGLEKAGLGFVEKIMPAFTLLGMWQRRSQRNEVNKNNEEYRRKTEAPLSKTNQDAVNQLDKWSKSLADQVKNFDLSDFEIKLRDLGDALKEIKKEAEEKPESTIIAAKLKEAQSSYDLAVAKNEELEALKKNKQQYEDEKKAIEQLTDIQMKHKEALQNFINSTNEGLIKQAATLGMSETASLRFEMSLKGATEQQIKQATAMKSLITEYERQKNVMQSLDDMDKQIARLGKSDTEVKLMDLRDAGATDAQLKYAAQQLAAIGRFNQKQEQNTQKQESTVEKFSGAVGNFSNATTGLSSAYDRMNKIKNASNDELNYMTSAEAMRDKDLSREDRLAAWDELRRRQSAPQQVELINGNADDGMFAQQTTSITEAIKQGFDYSKGFNGKKPEIDLNDKSGAQRLEKLGLTNEGKTDKLVIDFKNGEGQSVTGEVLTTPEFKRQFKQFFQGIVAEMARDMG